MHYKFTFLYENLVQNYAQKALKQYGQKIVAVYPDEGSLYADHPFCILNANWISPDQQYVAQQYLNFISSSAMIKIAIQSGFRPNNQSILQDPAISLLYNQTFTDSNGVVSNANGDKRTFTSY